MKTIKRDLYLSRLRPFYESDFIKIIVGIRRCGKSVILEQIAEELEVSGVDKDHIIFVRFELIEFSEIKDAASLVGHVKSKMTKPGKYYLFFDEIQKVDDFEVGN